MPAALNEWPSGPSAAADFCNKIGAKRTFGKPARSIECRSRYLRILRSASSVWRQFQFSSWTGFGYKKGNGLRELLERVGLWKKKIRLREHSLHSRIDARACGVKNGKLREGGSGLLSNFQSCL
jgi:hypothetical protein